MSNKVIIHTNTRVVFGLTREDNPQITSDQSLVEVSPTFDIGDGPWKLDLEGILVRPTEEELEASDVDISRVNARRERFLNNYSLSLDDIIAASTQAQMATALKAWAALHKKLTNNIFN